MQITFLTQLDWLIRLILAGVCGYAIGYERNSRSKNAGTRTHLIVALSAAFNDYCLKIWFYGHHQYSWSQS